MMTENEYIIVSNKTNITTAIAIMRDVMEGKEYGVDSEQHHLIMRSLVGMQQKLFSLCAVVEVVKVEDQEGFNDE